MKLAVILSVFISANTNQPLFDDKPLFPEPLFSDKSMGQLLDADIQNAQQQQIAAQAKTVADRTINESAIDQEMRRQMREVSRYLYLYGIRNGSRFPGFVNDESAAARTQLTELVPNNPYAYGPTDSVSIGMAARYSNGSPQTGSPVWGDQWTENLQAQALDRIKLSVDGSLTPGIVDNWTVNPPSTWEEAPGTISCIGNNQGLFIVWGAGRDGKPIKNPANGRTLIISGTTSGTVNDRSAPNPGSGG